MIKIEKGIKVPSKHSYPFNELKIGESFKVGKYTRELHQKISGHAYYYSRSSKSFVCRKDEDGNLRVWRSL